MKITTHTNAGDLVEIDYMKKPVIEIQNSDKTMSTFLTPHDIYIIKQALEKAISLDQLTRISIPTIDIDNM